MMRWLFIVPGALVAVIIAISFYLQPNDFIGCAEKPETASTQCVAADAIVVVSGGDTNARTDEGIALFNNGWANEIVFSGAAQDKTGPSNAAAMRDRAILAGIPAMAIFVEESSETTAENAQNTQTIFEQNEYETVILVTSGYHERRATLEFEKESAGITVLNHPVLSDKDWSLWWWATPRGWWLAGGEIAKITAFYVGNIGS
jgi:uncharacterized SAM-binding protein YcdF (DUF218 family)